jgi:hypothetical protein
MHENDNDGNNCSMFNAEGVAPAGALQLHLELGD